MSVTAAPDEALIGRLQADATLATLAPGMVHVDFAPEGADALGVFVVVNLQIERSELEQGGTAFVIGRFQAKAVGLATSSAAVKAASDRIDALLNGASFSITGMSFMACHRVDRFGYVERDGPLIWQHRGCDFELWADPT